MKCLLALLLCLTLWNVPAAARDTMNNGAFAALPVLHQGRVKPIDSFARIHLKIFAGRDTLPGGMDANDWLAETLFDPAAAAERPIFNILKPENLSLPARKGRLYSFADVAPALKAREDAITKLLEKEETTWSDDQRALMDLHARSILYAQLLRSFSNILPLSLSLPESLRATWKIAPDKTPRTLEEFAPYERRLDTALKKIVRAKGEDIEKYTPAEKDIALLAWQIQMMRAGGADNVLLRIVPPQWGGDVWHAPWALRDSGQGSPAANDYLNTWKTMAAAWQAGDKTAWADATDSAQTQVAPHTPATLSLERMYNGLHPMGMAMILYFIAFLGTIMASFRHRALILRGAFIAIITGAALHTIALVARVVILERPPVGTLYESILFVSLICVIAALMAERKMKDGTGLMIAALSGGGLLFTAGAFSPPDTLEVLTAVLNTNFWLATHVLCITVGYGWCAVAGVLAHIFLLRRARGQDADLLERIIKTCALTALLFTAVGTILGGIWADQSWGRFWGWDPKENGALLIVLWLIWLLHGRIAGQVRRLSFMAGTAALTIIVALAWFGVNLLSTGLHSYGFIDGVAGGLAAFCAAEAALIGALWYKARQAEGISHA